MTADLLGSPSPVVLNFRGSDGLPIIATVARSVMLNLPQLPLMRVLASSGAMPIPPRQLHEPNPAAYMKLYLHYSDAWWRGGRYSGLDLKSGVFSNTQYTSRPILPGNDIMHDFPGAKSPAPLKGSYHDGHIRCNTSSLPTGRQRCRGYIQAQYSNDIFALMFYRSFGLLNSGHPIVNVTRVSHGAAGSWLLDEVHAALVELHSDLMGPGVAEEIRHGKTTQPDHAILSIWDADAPGFGAACHFSRVQAHEKAGDASLDVARHSLRPFLKSGKEGRVFVASEAFAPLQCWSEGALQMAENALQRLGVRRPPWMPESVYKDLLFKDPVELDTKEAQSLENDVGFAARHDILPQLAFAVDAMPLIDRESGAADAQITV